MTQEKSTKIGEIERYKGFDFDTKYDDRIKIANQLSRQKRAVERISVIQHQVDDALEPIVTQIRDAEKRKKKAIAIKNQADYLESQLANTQNKYEAAQIHQECEHKFGNGSPRKVISNKESEIIRIDRDLKKLRKRAKDVIDKSARIIKKLILDGNNLCYQGSDFIGLAALQSLVPVLANDYDVVVVFDSSIRRAVCSDDSGIRDMLGSDVQVHVVATGIKADETILNLAANEETTFVVSNDRFAEFGEKPAVQDERVIRHEIVADKVLINDLGVSETFNK